MNDLNIDWKSAPDGYPIWIESLREGEPSGWHKDVGRAYRDEYGREWTKPEEGFYVVHMPPTPWTGEGLPPVGTVCEYLFHEGNEWRQCEVVAHFRGMAVICDQDDNAAERVPAGHLRPIRTADQVAAEEREKAIAEAMKVMAGSGVHCSAEACRNIAEAYVGAGYRKHDAQQLHELQGSSEIHQDNRELAEQRLRRLAEIDSILHPRGAAGAGGGMHATRLIELQAESDEILSHYREQQA